jgi:hypothetical protein
MIVYRTPRRQPTLAERIIDTISAIGSATPPAIRRALSLSRPGAGDDELFLTLEDMVRAGQLRRTWTSTGNGIYRIGAEGALS